MVCMKRYCVGFALRILGCPLTGSNDFCNICEQKGYENFMNKLERLLRDFDENQLREINDFLNSSDGKRLKNRINADDRDKLMQEFAKLDPEEVKKKISGLNASDLKNIMKKF